MHLRRPALLAAVALLALPSAAAAKGKGHHATPRGIAADARALSAWGATLRAAVGPQVAPLQAAFAAWQQGPGACVATVEKDAAARKDGAAVGVGLTTSFLELQVAVQLADPLVAAAHQPVADLASVPMRTGAGRKLVKLIQDVQTQLEAVAAEDPQDLCAPLTEWEAAGFPSDETPGLHDVLTKLDGELGLVLDNKVEAGIERALKHAGLSQRQADRLLQAVFPELAALPVSG